MNLPVTKFANWQTATFNNRQLLKGIIVEYYWLLNGELIAGATVQLGSEGVANFKLQAQ